MRRQRTLPTDSASLNGLGFADSEKGDLVNYHSDFVNGGAHNGDAQNGADRTWRSFAPDKAEAEAIVALGPPPPPRASPKLSAATDVRARDPNPNSNSNPNPNPNPNLTQP